MSGPDRESQESRFISALASRWLARSNSSRAGNLLYSRVPGWSFIVRCMQATFGPGRLRGEHARAVPVFTQTRPGIASPERGRAYQQRSAYEERAMQS